MTHLTLEHREVVEDGLKEKMNFTETQKVAKWYVV